MGRREWEIGRWKFGEGNWEWGVELGARSKEQTARNKD